MFIATSKQKSKVLLTYLQSKHCTFHSIKIFRYYIYLKKNFKIFYK